MKSIITLTELTYEDAENLSIFSMLHDNIGLLENNFSNPVVQMNFNQFGEWVREQCDIAHGKNIPLGLVCQKIYIMYSNDKPVGIGKIRLSSNEKLLNFGGNIGYAISSIFRNLGFGQKLLRMLIDLAFDFGVNPIILSVNKNNIYSEKIIIKCGAILFKEHDEYNIYIIRR